MLFIGEINSHVTDDRTFYITENDIHFVFVLC